VCLRGVIGCLARRTGTGDVILQTARSADQVWDATDTVSKVVGWAHQMVHHGDEQIEEQGRAAGFHLHLHRAAALEGVAAADDEGEVVGAQLGVAGGSVGVGETGGGEDGAALDAGLQTLLFEREALEFGKMESMC